MTKLIDLCTLLGRSGVRTTHDVYCWLCLVTDKRYIGVSEQVNGVPTSGAYKRETGHLSDTRCGKGSAFADAIAKHGWDKFRLEWCATIDSEDLAYDFEVDMIAALKTQVPNGYNVAPGGKGPGAEISRRSAIKIHERAYFGPMRANNRKLRAKLGQLSPRTLNQRAKALGLRVRRNDPLQALVKYYEIGWMKENFPDAIRRQRIV
jgi:hypothetical protein